MSTTLTSVSKRLLERLPSPIAIHWGLVHRSESDSERMRQSWAALDSFLRYTAGIILADYLRGHKLEAVEELLPKFERPSLGHFCALVREGLRPLKDQPQHFLFHLYQWYYTEKGKPSEEAKRLDNLISRRNIDTHKAIRTEKELESTAKSLIFELQTLLHHAKWLTGYKLLQVSNTKPERRGGQRGSVLFYMGEDTNPLPKASRWSCTLFEETIYLSHPSGSFFLEVNPFIIVESIGRQPTLYLWVSTPNGKRIDLRCPETNSDTKKLPMLFEEEIAWSEWLDRRSELDPLHPNTLTAEFVSEDFQEIGMLIVKRYRVLERLGQGGMGIVYCVCDELFDETVALKILHLEQVDSSERERAMQEFRLMKSKPHPHILPVQNIHFLEDGRIALSMPVMKGTLKDLINSPNLTIEQVQAWATQLLSVLNFLHGQEKPIFHRDVKPSNVLLDAENRAHLSDFGIARQSDDIRITRTAEQLGSHPYMAPELLLGEDANASTDRFALSVSLHEILTGKLPHKNRIGRDIEGDFGQFIRDLGHENPQVRLQANWPPVTKPKATLMHSDSLPAKVNISIEEKERPANHDGMQANLLDEQSGEFKDRPKANHAVQTSDKATILAGLEMMPGMPRCEMHFILDDQIDRKLSLSTKDRVVFGKNKSKSDLRIALEPIVMEKGTNPTVVENNKRMTISMISSVHFTIYKSGNSVMIEDCRSTNGTLLNGKQVIARHPVELTDGSTIHVGKVLELEVTIFEDGSGVLLTQPKHYLQREHLILWGRVGLSNFQRGIIEEFDEMRHQYALEVIDDKACVVNYSQKKMAMADMKVGLRDGCPVHQGMTFDIGSATVVVDTDKTVNAEQLKEERALLELQELEKSGLITEDERKAEERKIAGFKQTPDTEHRRALVAKAKALSVDIQDDWTIERLQQEIDTIQDQEASTIIEIKPNQIPSFPASSLAKESTRVNTGWRWKVALGSLLLCGSGLAYLDRVKQSGFSARVDALSMDAMRFGIVIPKGRLNESIVSDFENMISAKWSLNARLDALFSDAKRFDVVIPKDPKGRLNEALVSTVETLVEAARANAQTATGLFNEVQVLTSTFTMGCNVRAAFFNCYPKHKVTLTNDYLIMKSEVTQELFTFVMGFNPSEHVGPKHPVETVSWNQTIEFSNQLNDMLGLEQCYSGNPAQIEWNQSCTGWRLPTEAEWEYAGQQYLDSHVWGDWNSDGETHPVCTGLDTSEICDMVGNVKEWVWDVYTNYEFSNHLTDPVVSSKLSSIEIEQSIGGKKQSLLTDRVYRSSSYETNSWLSRLERRDSGCQKCGDSSIGFRLVRTISD